MEDATPPEPPPRIRILVADDQALIRRGMSLMIGMEADMEVVGQAADGQEAVELAAALQPDVILMDLHMPRKGGVAATREVMLARPETHVLVLTTLSADEMVFDAVRAGAQAYLLKDASEQELLDTIRGLMRGESWLTPQIARKVMDQFRRLGGGDATAAATTGQIAHEAPAAAGPTGSGSPAGATSLRPGTVASLPVAGATAAGVPPGRFAVSGPPAFVSSPAGSHGMPARDLPTEALTAKEEQILALIVEGRSNKQIADAVFLAEGTVKNYVSRIMAKLHANTRTELAVMSLLQRRAR